MSSVETYVVVGASGSGKTFFLKNKFRQRKRKCFVVNGQDHDFANMSNFVQQTFDESQEFIKSYRDCNIIFDDVTTPTRGEASHIRKVATVNARHKNIGIGMNIHSITGNNLSKALISQFRYVVFCHESRNEQNWTTFTSRYTSIPATEAKSIWEDFFFENERFHYLVYDQVKQTWHVAGRNGEEIAGKKASQKAQSDISLSQLRTQCTKYLPDDNSKGVSLQLLDYIFARHPQMLGYISPQLEIGINKSKVHIMDLLYTASAEREIQSDEVVKIFRELTRCCNIPRCLVKNSKLSDAMRAPSKSDEMKSKKRKKKE